MILISVALLPVVVNLFQKAMLIYGIAGIGCIIMIFWDHDRPALFFVWEKER